MARIGPELLQKEIVRMNIHLFDKPKIKREIRALGFEFERTGTCADGGIDGRWINGFVEIRKVIHGDNSFWEVKDSGKPEWRSTFSTEEELLSALKRELEGIELGAQ